MTELATLDRAHAPVEFTPEQIQLIKRTICKPKEREATNDELALFIGQAKRTGLDPFSRQIYAMFRKSRGQEQMTIQAAIDGLRLIAERSQQYLGQAGPFWCGDDGVWQEIWPTSKGFPVASKVIVRKLIGGQVAETPGVAHWDEYAVYYGDRLADMWKGKPALMLSKCAEALALRKAFPNDMSGIYTDDEMGRADAASGPPPVVQEVNQHLGKALALSDVPTPPVWPAPNPEPIIEANFENVPADPMAETVDPAFANDILDEFKRKQVNVGQRRELFEAIGVDPGENDLRSGEKLLALIVTLTVAQAIELTRAISDLPEPQEQAA